MAASDPWGGEQRAATLTKWAEFGDDLQPDDAPTMHTDCFETIMAYETALAEMETALTGLIAQYEQRLPFSATQARAVLARYRLPKGTR